MSARDEMFMRAALDEARLAFASGETPVGAVIVRGDTVVAHAHNTRESDKNALAHAELAAINSACLTLGGWRLWQCEMYVTLEPCPMCAGALIQSRVRRVCFGARDAKAGCVGSVVDLFSLPFNHRPAVCGGILEKECAALLAQFFAELRRKKENGDAF